MSDATIVLGRDGMGNEADEADFDAWVAYVSEHIDAATGLDIAVETHHPRDVQNTVIRGTDDTETIHYAINSLWDEFCADATAWPSRVHCECGTWTGEACAWHGPKSETVVVEYMPAQHRASHDAANNRGVYPHNGAVRVRVERSCADALLSTDADWSSVVEVES